MAAPELAAAAAGSLTANQPPKPSQPAVRLAVAIGLFWLSGLCLFIAFGSGAAELHAWSSTGGGIGELRRSIGRVFSSGESTVKGATAKKASGG